MIDAADTNNGQAVKHFLPLYLLSDELGSSTIALSSTGSIVAVQLFAPFGSSRYSLGTMPTTYNFTGQRLDSETGLLYYGARYYDPFSARFIQADSVQNNANGMDPYAYVGENPETLSDPSGERFISPSGGQEGPQGPITTGGSSYSSQPATGVEQQAISYQNLLNPGAASNGLPLLLNAFLNDHQSWVMAESYAQNQLHTSLLYLLGMEAWDLIHDAGINWNATTTMMHLFLRLNGVAMAYAMASTGTGLEGGGVTDAQALVSDSETTLASESDIGVCGGGLSFMATTLVATAHGKQTIGTMKVGEQVWAYNPKTKKMELQLVQHVWINHDNDLVDLTLTITTAAKHSKAALKTSETIHTNKKHPFLTKEKGFLPVGQITIGMHVLRADGTYGVVTGWKLVPGIRAMYNLEVAQDHTFTIGAGQWVVHNCGSTGNTSPVVDVQLSRSSYPETTQHIEDAINTGQPDILTLDNIPANMNARRANSLRGYPTKAGYDRDEYPPAISLEGGTGADIRYVSISDNRGAGSSMRSQLRGYPVGTRFRFVIVP